ncbi:hypothetical protein [Pseudomonas sp. PDM19]|uniref:hypothetical protein n=1 Tax=Pseudomonas sp. PDM19 TaxID=2769272 RepID=UPI0017809375|nr:hypothetical protein [Pseudomonas sp. PDM19]MBD9629352.1 hypothetical protein [Pseudomonas sp. PDM19]
MTLPFSAEGDDLEKITCRLGNPPSYDITITESLPIESTKLYSIKLPNSIDSPIYSGKENTPEDAIQLSRGSDVTASCLGHPEKILFISGEFSSNFIQGIIFRYDSKLRSLQRLDTYERSPASKIYLGEKYFSVVVPSDFRETSKRYLIYKYSTHKENRETPSPSNKLPNKKNRQIVNLPRPPEAVTSPNTNSRKN